MLFASTTSPGQSRLPAISFTDEAARPAALAILGDARHELGDYAAAAEAYDDISGPMTAPLLARQARLAAVAGDSPGRASWPPMRRPWRQLTRIRPPRTDSSTTC